MPVNCSVCGAENHPTATTCTVCGCPLTPATPAAEKLPPGTLLQKGSYKIDTTLGQGGFGITYKGTYLPNSATVAIKELFPQGCSRTGTAVIWPFSLAPTPKAQRQQIDKFKKEAEYLSKCKHPNIVSVSTCFEENSTAYIVMAFIEGRPLSSILKERGYLPDKTVKPYFIQLAEALKVVHSNNLLHRDIKPENIIIDSRNQAILIDFGAAREFLAGQTGKLTVILTPGYAPLEQYSPTGERWAATDFYAVCASMYEALTGEVPPDAPQRHSSAPLIPPSQIVAIDPLTEQVILTGMKMRVEERFQTADELIDALKGKFVSPALRQARQLAQQGQLQQAVQAYERCLANEPSNGEASAELSLALIYIDDTKAADAARKAIQLQPTDGRGYGVLGLVCCRQSKWAEATHQLQQAANLTPNESWIQANLAWALAKTGNWQPAEAAVQRALQLDSNSAFALGLKSWIAVSQGKWKVAIPAATQAITKSKQTNSNYSTELQRWVYPCLTVALDRELAGQPAPDVDRRLQEFTAQVPDSAFPAGFKGWKAACQGRWAEALSHFERASRQAKVPAWVWVNLGIAHEQLNNTQAAIQAYQGCSQTFPDYAFTLFRLGTLLGRQGQWSQARSYLEKAVQLKPDSAEAYHNLAWVLLNMKSPDGRLQSFREMRSAYYKAAGLYAQQHKPASALAIQQAFQLIGVEL